MYRFSDEQHPRLNDLSNAVRGIVAPFLCSGSQRLPTPVSLRFPDGSGLVVRPSRGHFDQEKANEALQSRCKPASRGNELQGKRGGKAPRSFLLGAGDKAFSVSGLELVTTGILEEIRAILAPMDPEPLTAELVELQLHHTEDHSPVISPAKSASRGGQTLGTLLVCLPSCFSAGQISVVYRGAHKTFDWGQEIDEDSSPERIRWVAFADGAELSSERLWSGSRVTLTYAIRRGQNALSRLGAPSIEHLLGQAFDDALADKTFLRDGGTLVFPCLQEYLQEPEFQAPLKPFSARSANTLRGRDRILAKTALARGLSVELCPYLIETSAEQRWQLSRFPTEDELDKMTARLSERELASVLPLKTPSKTKVVARESWVIPPPSFNWAPYFYGRDERGQIRPANPDLPALTLLRACEFSAGSDAPGGGNETEFYLYAELRVALGKAGGRSTTTPDVDHEPPPDEAAPAKSRLIKKSKAKATPDETLQENREVSDEVSPEKKPKTTAAKTKKAAVAKVKDPTPEEETPVDVEKPAAKKKAPAAKKSPLKEKAEKAKKPEKAGKAEKAEKPEKAGVKKWSWSF